MKNSRFILEPYKGMNSRYHCPELTCKGKTFVRYIDLETGNYIHSTVGRCNRESNCGFHYTPREYFQDNNISIDNQQHKINKLKSLNPQPKSISFIPVEIFKASLKDHKKNNFVIFLINLFGVDITNELISRYFIATSKHWKGATVFWQIDIKGNVRTGKIMLYNESTGKRVKNLSPPVHWVHKAIHQPEFELKQCLFGEHLLIDKSKPIAIVESEKTAIISSVYLPQFTWLAAGGIENLSIEKCKVLKGLTITLFPDLKGFEKWSAKAKELSKFAFVTISDLLETKATDTQKKEGLDIADYLIRFNIKEFIPIKELHYIETEYDIFEFEEADPSFLFEKSTDIECSYVEPIKKEPENWNSEIEELENFFKTATIPEQLFGFQQCNNVLNVSSFIESQFAALKFNNGNPTFLPFLKRLIELKRLLS